MSAYNHKRIEKKWQTYWAKKGLYKTPNSAKGKDNFFLLTEFPYPSGNLHVGHWYAFSIPDILARHLRMAGKNVMYPIGFDAFGLPAENAAIKNKLNPRKWTEKNIAHMTKQLKSMGTSFDWSREIQTIDPAYYKWTQWQFLQFFKNGLAYRKHTPANWCPSCKTVLANEQVVNGKCERCGTEVVQREMMQWNIRITKYADRLVDDLDGLNWPEQIKESQRNWIGRSDGAEIDFPLTGDDVQRIILLHGKGGSPTGGPKVWLKERLEKLGYEVQVPALPNTDAPDDEEQADYVQKHCTLDEKTAIVAHSFGGIVALRLLERGVKVRRVALIGTPFSGTYLDGKPRPSVTAALKKGFDFEKIRKQAAFVALYDTGDRAIPVSDGEAYARELGAYVMKGKANESHYNGTVEPDVLSVCIPVVRVFTTRADTLFGATHLVMAPEHPWLLEGKKWKGKTAFGIQNWDDVEAYQERASKKTELERQTETKDKTGVKLEGIEAINPATGARIPVYIADYVLAHYGTGAIMAVPAHDERDFAFAQKFEIPVKKVVNAPEHETSEIYTGDGHLIHSGEFDGLDTGTARQKITEKFGQPRKTYKLRDWIVSRQRYWGVPIPIIHCPKCGEVPVPEKELPVKLPEVKDYLPEGSGKSPLAKATKWVRVKCPLCKTIAERETDTFDTFVDSSWYFQRYVDPKNKRVFADGKKLASWLPVDLYSGGAEHTTMHVLYSRFWQKAMFDLGLVADKEPYARRMNRSLIMGPDGQKMSKSKGNVIDPDEVVERLGADTVRMYLAFIGPYNEVSSYPWNPDGVVGVRRFIERVWKLKERVRSNKEVSADTERVLHQTIKKLTEDIPALKFNTAISQMMIFVNEAEKRGVTSAQYATLLILLAPFAPHVAEELWTLVGKKKSVHLEKWPTFDATKIKTETVTIAVQVNGKTRGTITVSADTDEKTIQRIAEIDKAIIKHVAEHRIARVIYVKGRLLNFVLAVN